MFNLNLPFANINRRRRRRGSSNNNDNDNDTTSINEADNNNILHNDDDDDNNKNKKQHHHHHRHNHNGRNNLARRATLTDGQHRAAIRRARSHHANSESNTSRTVLSSSRSVDDNGYYDNNNNANANANANNLPKYPLHHIHYNERGKGYTPQHKNKQQQQRTYNDANNNNNSNNFDPLRYRLEHQKSVRIEKEKKAKNNNNNKQRIRQRRKSGCSSSSTNKSTNNNNNNNNGGECCDDPFDLGSSTSDEDDDDVSIDASKGDFGAWGDDDDDDNNNYEKDHHHDEEEEDASKGDFGGWEGAYADDDDGEDILGGVGGVMDHDRIESSENNSSGEGLFIDYGSIKTAERRKLPKFLFATPEIGLGEGLKRITKSKRRSNKSSNNGGGRRKSQEDGGSSSNSRRRRRNNQSSTNGVSSRRRRNGHHQSGRRESQSSISSPKRRKSKTEEEEEEEEASLHYGHANDDEENDDRSVATTPEGLFVDFGGFLPQEIRGIYNLNDDSDLRRRSDTTAGAVKNQKRHNRLTASITSATAASHQSVHSSLSSVTNFTNYWHDDDDNTTICTTQFDDDKNVGYDVDEHDEEEEVDGLSVEDEKLSSSRATHAELEEILSFLEKESLSPDDPASKGRKSSPLPPSDKPRMKRISSHDHISSFIGEAVNTMKRVTSHKSLSNLQSQQLPLSNNLHRDEDLTKSEKSLTRRLVMSKEEEENPRLYQLNQSSMEELQLEWSKMQSSTKSNLESSWAETERLKCENADIDDQIGEVKKKLEMAKLSSSLKVDQVHLVLTKFDGSDMGSSASINANIIKPRRRQSTIPAFRRGSLRDKLRKSTSSKSLGDKYQLEEEMKEDTALDDSHVSFRTAPVNVQMLDVDGGALDALLEAENGDNIMGQDISSVISSDLGLEVDLLYNEAVAIKSPLEEYCKPISQQDTPEIDDKIFNELLAPKEGDYVDLSFSDKRADESGVFYPAPTKVPDDDSVVSSSADEDAHSNAHLSVHTGALAASLAMDDFDFDPLNTLGAEDMDVNDCKSVKSFKSIKSTKSMKSAAKLMNDKLRMPSRRQTIDRRPSIMDLFNKQDGDDDDDDDDDSIISSSPPLTSDYMPTKDKDQIKKEAAEVMGSIQANEKEIANLIESIQTQEDEIETRESEINDANVNCCQSEKQLREKEFTLQQENEELAEKDAKTEAKLDDIEDVERKAKEKEQYLILQLESMVDTEKEIEIELEKQLDLWKQEWGTIQAEAIKSVSDLLSDFDAMQIPSLQNEIDNSVRGDDEGLSSDIITRFEAFTDKGEQLVEALCGLYPERLTSSSNWDHEQYQFKSGQYE